MSRGMLAASSTTAATQTARPKRWGPPEGVAGSAPGCRPSGLTHPNFLLQWQVAGELAIGVFTMRPVKAGEELTFDYNFDRDGYKVRGAVQQPLALSYACL